MATSVQIMAWRRSGQSLKQWWYVLLTQNSSLSLSEMYLLNNHVKFNISVSSYMHIWMIRVLSHVPIHWRMLVSHYSDVTWASRRLKSRALRFLFNRLFCLTSNKTSKFRISGSLCWESPGDWWISLTRMANNSESVSPLSNMSLPRGSNH